MNITNTKLGRLGLSVALLSVVACGKKVEDKGASKDKDQTAASTGATDEPKAGGIKADKGVDIANKVVMIGALNDESGPAAAIGKPFADGKRLAVAVVNAGGILPEGWTVKLVEKDHGYNPQKSVQEFNAVKDEVLYVATSFGTPNTLPLGEMLAREDMAAFPASLSSQMAENANTPPLGPNYQIEVQRAADWAVADAGGADKLKAGIVYQKDDYGEDGLRGLKAAAAHHGFEIVTEQTISPGQKDVTAAVTSLKDKGATHVFLTVLPPTAGALVGTAAAMKYGPKWLGNTPTWVDAFFSEKSPLPPAVLANFHWIVGMPFWGEEIPGMDKFLAAYEAHKAELSTQNPDFYVLISYLQGMVQFEALRLSIESGDVTRKGYMASIKSIKDFNAGGLLNPVNLSVFPYQTGTLTRILKPDFEKKSWTVVADYADPTSLVGAAKEEGVPPVAKPVEK